MACSSSPVVYPMSSSPPCVHKQKRKLFQTLPQKDELPKKRKTLGGFELHGESSDEETVQSWEGKSIIEKGDSICTDAIERTHLPTFHSPDPTERGTNPVISEARSRLETSRCTASMKTSTGKTLNIRVRRQELPKTYEQTIAGRSAVAPGRAKRAYYGIDIHELMSDAKAQSELKEAAKEYREQQKVVESIENPTGCGTAGVREGHKQQLWTEKYRAKKFTDLVGDERTHRQVLRWLKSWDPVVFPGNIQPKPKRIYEDFDHEKQHRKILLLCGQPGLGKTTLAHVCAKQAGYEALEINASDDRSRDVVRGRVKDALGTETVRGVRAEGQNRKAGRPVCVVIDEVDGVVTGSSSAGGEGGFIRALIDLVQLDQRNSVGQAHHAKAKRGADKFRLMRPLILICNDVYAPSLRPLRQSSIAEIIHVRKAPLEKVVARLKTVFENENVQVDNDAVRRLCESSWGLGTRLQNSLGSRGAGEGDIRSVLVQGEWAARKMQASSTNSVRLTRKWVDAHLGEAMTSQKGLGRGGVREVVERVFLEGAGLPNLRKPLSKEETRQLSESSTTPTGIADLRKRTAILALREMIDAAGDHDRLVTECFASYPTQVFQDDTVLSKPNEAYEWLYFHDRLSSKVYTNQDWELSPYLGTTPCGFHNLFAGVDKGSKLWDEKQTAEEGDVEVHPYSGIKADFAAREAEKANHAILAGMQSNFTASMLRLFSSAENLATELVPTVAKILAPDIKPVVVGGSGGLASVASVRKDTEKLCVQNAVRVMHGLGIEFEKVRIENEGGGAHGNGGFVLRMEPPIDNLTAFYMAKVGPASSTASSASSATGSATTLTQQKPAPVRYSIRQVLAQELAKEKALQNLVARENRASRVGSATHFSDQAYDMESNKENHPILATPANTKQLRANPLNPASALTNIGSIATKKDFFGRPIVEPSAASLKSGGHMRKMSSSSATMTENDRPGSSCCNRDGRTGETKKTEKGVTTWVTFHEGYNNAVRRYISLGELMDGF